MPREGRLYHRLTMRLAPLLYFTTGIVQPPTYALDAGALARRQNVEGPEGKVGLLSSPIAYATALDYDASAQRWVRLSDSGGGELWLGIDQRTGHAPADFARAVTRGGHVVTLGDGHGWEIPPARLALGGTGLPRRRVLGEQGAARWEVDAAYCGLAKDSERLWNARQGIPERITEEDLDQIIGEALSVNYRIHSREAIALGLMTDDAIRGVVDALLDWPVVRQLVDAEKKSPRPVT